MFLQHWFISQVGSRKNRKLESPWCWFALLLCSRITCVSNFCTCTLPVGILISSSEEHVETILTPTQEGDPLSYGSNISLFIVLPAVPPHYLFKNQHNFPVGRCVLVCRNARHMKNNLQLLQGNCQE